MRFCTQCGAELPEGHAFCSNCGAPAAGTQPQAPANEPVRENFTQENVQPEIQQNEAPQTNNYQYSDNSYQQPFTQPAGGLRYPIQKRDLAMCIVLSIVTCGIYGLYWYFCIINDLNTVSETPNDASAGKVLLLTIVTCGIYGWIWLYRAGDKIDALKERNGEVSSNSALLYILLAVFQLSIVDYCLIQLELNKVAAE